jgi:hypothetical protein
LQLTGKKDLPIEAVPMHIQFLEVLTRLSNHTEEIFLEFETFSIALKNQLHEIIPKFLQMHHSKMTDHAVLACFKMLPFCTYDAKFENIFDFIGSDLERLNLYLSSQVNDYQNGVWVYFNFVALLPFKESKITDLKTMYNSPPSILINLDCSK